MLLIAGRGEEEANRRVRDASPDSVILWELPTTPHVGALASHPEEWERRVVDFLDASLSVER